MTRKYLKERQQRNQELGKADMLNRCTFCRRSLPSSGAIVGWYGGLLNDNPVKFCNESCAADFDEAKQMEARR